MAQLSLRTRRARARGLNRLQASAWGGRLFRGIGGRATGIISPAGANNDIQFIATVPGTAGNSITVTFVVGGSVPTVGVVGNAITVTAPVSATANQVIDAINRDFNAEKLLWAQNAPQHDGTGPFAAVGATSLSGGTNAQ